LLCTAPKYYVSSIASLTIADKRVGAAQSVRHAMLSRHMLHILIYFV